ncbi:MAG TPA: hypothetical protein VD929_11050 [Caulobacteraceae bacterium]|nr:hypothetical protein [Caulobacteraceae bacterium]
MNAERFEAMVAAYGAEPRRWPEEERAAALAFLNADPVAERLLFEARMTDAALSAAPSQVAGAALRDRVLAAAPQPRPERAAWWSKPFLSWGAGLAAASVAGVVAGSLYIQAGAADLAADEVLAAAGETYELSEDAA